MTTMAPIWSKQPFKTIYTTVILFETLAFVPWLLIRFSLQSARPYPEWSLKTSVLTPIFRIAFKWYTATRYSGMSAVISDHKKASHRHALAAPADASYYSGVLAPGKAVPAPVGGLWYPTPLFATSPDIENTKVVLHFPGGAFVLAFGQETWGKVVTGALLKYSKASHAFFAQYRVVSDDTTRFPAAIQDILTCYNYILSLGIRPQNVIIGGDSAAGNLVLGLLRHMETSPPISLPFPGAVMLWSPWVHVTSRAGADFRSQRTSANDSITADLLQWGADAYFPDHEPTEEEVAYISPLNHPFHASVPLYIHACTAEGLYYWIQEFADQMANFPGNRVKFSSTRNATHDLIFAYDREGREEDVKLVIEEAMRFFEL
ncbi:hypothetical protein NPX13_g3379 [Xylaria arbuscula]|uniref:Alpha/beta hydrolase fold-3 domain-containing protein n=1 Tax=Xylaria arbuscula TaxID=114810 RepID=A0A9W8NHE9_9PEZI|nr:hypothetical protein NPX13_g3379 [Xylaria arbuscula]